MAPSALSRASAEVIADSGNVILVSAASAWEIATKLRLGKLPGAEKLERNYLDILAIAGYIALPIDSQSALRAGRFVAAHRDPFDRILAAQALDMDIPILSPDTQLDQFGVRRIW
jgi:PIN domain nuclease of toxin-antitoxin system